MGQNIAALAIGGDSDEDLDMEIVRYRPESVEALMKITKFNANELKTMYRGFKQECPSGTVNEERFRHIYSQFFPQGDSNAYAHFVFKTFDKNRTGVINFQDFVCGLSTLARGTVDEKLRWAFTLYDLNADGAISRDEMMDIVSAVYDLLGNYVEPYVDEHTTAEHVDFLFEKMDLDRDGFISRNEFFEVCTKDEQIRKSLMVLDTVL